MEAPALLLLGAAAVAINVGLGQPSCTSNSIMHQMIAAICCAQAVTLGALGLIAAVDLYDTRQQSDLHHARLTALEQQQMEKAHASGHTHKT